jgi:RNA polymerase sigma factor (sigma-70 family)
VSRHSDFDADFLFAELCLAGKGSALAELRGERTKAVLKFLEGAGVPRGEADDVLHDLVVDLVTTRDDRRPMLACYRGDCLLVTWLNRAALNRVIDRRRVEERRQQREAGSAEAAPEMDDPPANDDALRDLLRTAVQCAFDTCSAEDFVLLYLRHAGELHFKELSRMFGNTEKTISSRAERAAADVRFAITAEIERRDPWLKLSYEDIIELLRPDLPELFERRAR